MTATTPTVASTDEILCPLCEGDADDGSGDECFRCDGTGTIDNSIIESPSGWSFRASQENGDTVDCQGCGSPLDDDFPIVNDDDGYARHPHCR